MKYLAIFCNVSYSSDMINSYFYTKTNKINDLLTKIETYKGLFEKLPVIPQVQENFLRKSTLKSSLFSARIEGNSLELKDLDLVQTNSQEKREVIQIFKALKSIRSLKGKLSKKKVLHLHTIVMDGLSPEVGKFRTEPSAIFNSAGIPVYIPPSPQKIDLFFNEFLKFVNSEKKELVRVAIAHFNFEKIHPFLDGNGRLGRILMNWYLLKMGYDFGGLLSFDEYLEQNRELYYEGLSEGGKDITRFVEFILEGIAQGSERIIIELQQIKVVEAEDALLPRRLEILYLIREHSMMSFNQIQRRFLKVGSRSLHYDIEHLIKRGFIKKLGNTNGACYVPIMN